jgi:predicted hydrocarbon binding protein
MMKPNPSDVWYIVGYTLGRTLYKFTNEKEVESMLKQTCQHARTVYKEIHQEEAEKQSKQTTVKH